MPVFNPISDKKSILIIDDDEAIKVLINAFLKKHGKWETYHASNGKEGLEVLTGIIPDIILCDIIMPEMNGLEFFNTLKSNDDYCDIPFLFISARDRKEDKMLGFQLGADDYIVKPFKSMELISRLNAALLRSDKTREVYQPVNLNGSLIIHSVKDVLKMPSVAKSGKGTLVIEDENYKPIGALYLKNGLVVNAVYENIWGIESAYKLFEIQSGFYNYYPNIMNNNIEPSINQSISDVINIPAHKNPYML